jgi:hypothetical protein
MTHHIKFTLRVDYSSIAQKKIILLCEQKNVNFQHAPNIPRAHQYMKLGQ